MRPRIILLILLLTATGVLARKVQAPVTFKGATEPTQAQIWVTFDQPAEAVEIKVWGTGALAEQLRPSVTRYTSVTKGRRLPLNVSYTTPTGPASVAISVSGLYGGQKLMKVGNYPVGEPAAPQKTTEDADGEKVIVLPGKVVD